MGESRWEGKQGQLRHVRRQGASEQGWSTASEHGACYWEQHNGGDVWGLVLGAAWWQRPPTPLSRSSMMAVPGRPIFGGSMMEVTNEAPQCRYSLGHHVLSRMEREWTVPEGENCILEWISSVLLFLIRRKGSFNRSYRPLVLRCSQLWTVVCILTKLRVKGVPEKMAQCCAAPVTVVLLLVQLIWAHSSSLWKASTNFPLLQDFLIGFPLCLQ